MSVCCAVKGNPTQFNLVSCTLQRKFKELKLNKTKWYKVRVRQERKQSAGVFASKYVSVRPRRKWLYGQLWDVDGCCGCIRHTDILICVYIYIYNTVTGAEINMRWAQNIRQNRNVTLTWSCLQKWGLAWRALRGCSSARSRTQVGVEYDVNETCKMIKAYLTVGYGMLWHWIRVFQVSKRLVFSDTWMLECWQLRWLQDGANWWLQRSPQTGEEELCHSGMPWQKHAKSAM